MTTKHRYTYKELRQELSRRLGRVDMFPTGTLSRWMKDLEYPKGKPGRKRKWEEEDVWAFCFYHQALHEECLDKKEAKSFTEEKIYQWRTLNNGTQY
jgi:hypothetical protein